MSLLSRTASSCALVSFGVVMACGARTGLPLGPLPCDGTALPLVPRAPNLYFILDHSGSMVEDIKWQTVREAVANLIVSLGQKATFGAAAFPSPNTNECATGNEVMALTPGDGLAYTQAGSTAFAFLAATNVRPFGGTPTAATFRALTPELATLEGHTFAVLATDGGPDCNPEVTSCAIDECTPNLSPDPSDPGCTPTFNCCGPIHGNPENCLDAVRTVAAVAALKEAGVLTFVIGLPSSEAFANVLDEMATAGGTAQTTEPLYYPVGLNADGQADSTALDSALTAIATRIITSCDLTLEDPPPSGPDLINVVLDGKTVPQRGSNGWALDGKTVTLFGQACDQLQEAGLGDAGTQYAVTSGCPTLKE
jgi:hypothetical protein